MKNNTLNKLKSDYEELEIKPSFDLWDKLDEKLDETSEIALKPSFQWWKYAAVVVFLISLGSLFYFNSDKIYQGKKITKKTSENIQAPLKEQLVPRDLNENSITHQTSSKSYKDNQSEHFFKKENSPEESKNMATAEKVDIIVEAPIVSVEKHDQEPKPLVASQKRTSYISAEDLLVGRELDKAREENYNDQRKFGVVDMSKIKIKGPNSLKILGFTVISDSVKTK